MDDGRAQQADRIVEVLDGDHEHFYDNPHVGYIAYVPRGSIERGRALVAAGSVAAGSAGAQAAALPEAQSCTTCHGADLHGSGPAPPLAAARRVT